MYSREDISRWSGTQRKEIEKYEMVKKSSGYTANNYS